MAAECSAIESCCNLSGIIDSGIIGEWPLENTDRTRVAVIGRADDIPLPRLQRLSRAQYLFGSGLSHNKRTSRTVIDKEPETITLIRAPARDDGLPALSRGGRPDDGLQGEA